MAHLPEPLYRHLPNICIVSGTGIAITMENTVGVISSLLLVMAGLFIFNFRIEFRKKSTAKSMRVKQPY